MAKKRTAAQKRATAKLVAFMKKKRKGNPPKTKGRTRPLSKRAKATHTRVAKSNSGKLRKAIAAKLKARKENKKVAAMMKRLSNPSNLRKVPNKGTGWIKATAVKIVGRGKTRRVLIQK